MELNQDPKPIGYSVIQVSAAPFREQDLSCWVFIQNNFIYRNLEHLRKIDQHWVRLDEPSLKFCSLTSSYTALLHDDWSSLATTSVMRLVTMI